MNTRLSKNIFVLAAGALAGFGIASGAQAAQGMAQSVVSIQDFTFSNNATATTLNAATDFIGLIASDSAQMSAVLNGVGPAPVGGNFPVNPPTDLKQVCNTGQNCVSPFAENDYTRHVTPPTQNVSRADQALQGAIITGLGPATPAASQLVSEVQVLSPGQGSANTTSGTGGTFLFTLANNGIQVKISFTANVWEIAQVTPGVAALAGQSLNFTLENLNTQTTVFEWAPNGQAGGITGGTEVADSFSLQRGVSSTTINNGPNCFNNGVNTCTPGALVFLPFTAITDALPSVDALGVPIQYELTFTQSTQASLRVVPEPTTLALLGALAVAFGFGGGSWRRRRAS